MKQRSKWFIFLLLAAAQFMVVLDISIVNVALPTIKEALGFNEHTLQWVVTVYALTFGGFLLLGGRASDLFGRKRILLIGMLGFTVFSLLIGFAQSAAQLIVLRALQGLAGALMSPAALSIVITTFKEGAERNRAFGLWTSVATGGGAVGLLLGGVLSQYLSWRWNFFVNVPAGILVSIGIIRAIPNSGKQVDHNHLDLSGAVLVTSGLIAFVLAISQGPAWGWGSVPTIGVFAASILLLAGFIFNEYKSAHPLMPLSIFRIRNVVGANLMMAPISAALFGMFFLVSLYVQAVLGFSPVMTGLAFLPFPLIVGFMGPRISGLVTKYGYKRFLLMGPIIVAAAMTWLARVPVHGNYFIDVLPTILLMPIGMGMTFMPIIVAATSGVPSHEAGLASGLINTAQQMGGALGLALLTGIASTVSSGGLAHTAQNNGIPGPDALVRGYNYAFTGAVAFIIFALILAITVIRQRRNAGKLSMDDIEPPTAM